MTQLRPEELRQLANLGTLRSLSLPSVRLDPAWQGWPAQQELLLNTPHLTSLSLGCEYLQPMPLTYHGQLRSLRLCAHTSGGYECHAICNIEKLASIPFLSLVLNLRGKYKAVEYKALERLLLCPGNIRCVHLIAEYCDQTTALLEAVSQTSVIVRLCLYNFAKQDYAGCSQLYNWTSNTSITSLKVESVRPGVVSSSACMNWLLALEISDLRAAPRYGFSFTSHLTNLTSLRVSSECVASTSWTCLHMLKSLASCSLEAVSRYSSKTFMHHGSDALFCMDALTHLKVCALLPVPGVTDYSNLRSVSSNICCLEFEGHEDVSDYIIQIIARMTCLTRLSLSGKTFPFELSSISNLRWLKELRLLSSTVSPVHFDFVCGLQYLAYLQLERLDMNDDTFLHAAMLDKLTTLDLYGCSQLTDAVFVHVKCLVSLRELRIVNCFGVAHIRYETPSVLACLSRLRSVCYS